MIEKAKYLTSISAFYHHFIYSSNDIQMVSIVLENGCKSTTLGSFIEYLSNKGKVYAMIMLDGSYDIGDMGSYLNVCNISKSKQN